MIFFADLYGVSVYDCYDAYDYRDEEIVKSETYMYASCHQVLVFHREQCDECSDGQAEQYAYILSWEQYSVILCFDGVE